MARLLINWIYLLRPEQWVKNLLVLAPPFFGGVLFTNQDMFLKMVLAFLAFSLASSTGYITNDISDIESDKLHPKKKLRPIASGRISITEAIILGLITLALSLGLSLYISKIFLLIIVIYLVLSLLYSFYLEKIVILDALIIAIGFVLRIEAGIRISSYPERSFILKLSVKFLI